MHRFCQICLAILFKVGISLYTMLLETVFILMFSFLIDHFTFGAIVAASRVLHVSAIFPVFAVILYLSLFN